jgi:hypothetical protein
MGCDRPLGAGNEVVMNRPGHSVRILSITAYVARPRPVVHAVRIPVIDPKTGRVIKQWTAVRR